MAAPAKIPRSCARLRVARPRREIDGATVQEVLDGLFARHDELRARLYDEDGGLRRFVNVYVAGEDIRFLDGLKTPVEGWRRADDPPGGRWRLGNLQR